MSSILSRIQEMAINEEITIGALERKIGASKGVLSRAINNGTDIQSKWIGVLADNYPQYSTRWLLTGHGSMFHNVQEQTAPQPVSLADESFIYRMYKEKDTEVGVLKEEIGALKLKVSQLELSQGKSPIQHQSDEVVLTFTSDSLESSTQSSLSMRKPTNSSKISLAGKM